MRVAPTTVVAHFSKHFGNVTVGVTPRKKAPRNAGQNVLSARFAEIRVPLQSDKPNAILFEYRTNDQVELKQNLRLTSSAASVHRRNM